MSLLLHPLSLLTATLTALPLDAWLDFIPLLADSVPLSLAHRSVSDQLPGPSFWMVYCDSDWSASLLWGPSSLQQSCRCLTSLASASWGKNGEDHFKGNCIMYHLKKENHRLLPFPHRVGGPDGKPNTKTAGRNIKLLFVW